MRWSTLVNALENEAAIASRYTMTSAYSKDRFRRATRTPAGHGATRGRGVQVSETKVPGPVDSRADTISVEELESEALAFLEANATPRADARFEWGQGSDRVSLIRESTPEEDLIEGAEAGAWSAEGFHDGF